MVKTKKANKKKPKKIKKQKVFKSKCKDFEEIQKTQTSLKDDLLEQISESLGIYKEEKLDSFKDMKESNKISWDTKMKFFILDYMTDFNMKRACKKFKIRETTGYFALRKPEVREMINNFLDVMKNDLRRKIVHNASLGIDRLTNILSGDIYGGVKEDLSLTKPNPNVFIEKKQRKYDKETKDKKNFTEYTIKERKLSRDPIRLSLESIGLLNSQKTVRNDASQIIDVTQKDVNRLESHIDALKEDEIKDEV